MTGRKKNVLITKNGKNVYPEEIEDVFLSFLPLHHVYECVCGFLTPIYNGSTVAYCEGIRYIQDNMREAHASVFLAVPLVFEKMYPILGNGAYATFVAGLSNMFIFQGLAYIYFIPPKLKEPNQLKKVAVTSVILSCIFLLISVAIILFMFDGFVETDELLPLYSAVKYVEFGSFLQKLDSTFVLIWIIAFISYLGMALKFSSNILKKLTNTENENIFTYLLAIALFFVGIWQKNYELYKFLGSTVYKYSFFILVVGISLLILLSATIKQKIRKWFK